MKKIIVSVFILLVSLGFAFNTTAQELKPMKLEHIETGSPAEYLLPSTTVKVKVVVEKEIIKTGPYARFAQKYLGSIAPLTDKETYRIKSAVVGAVDGECALCNFRGESDTEVLSHVNNSEDFSRSLPDRVSLTDRSMENNAREAAMTIFSLRKRRMELITGEAGENVFGEGLEAAIAELHRVENEYLSLFFGKQVTKTETKEFEVVPKMGVTNNIVFRFSQTQGVMSADDVSGAPIVLTVQPEQNVVGGDRNSGNRYDYYQVPGWAKCRLVDGATELAAARVSLYQFGTTVSIRK